eukprot:1152324-Pyramimonas_sp.AAC.1
MSDFGLHCTLGLVPRGVVVLQNQEARLAGVRAAQRWRQGLRVHRRRLRGVPLLGDYVAHENLLRGDGDGHVDALAEGDLQ